MTLDEAIARLEQSGRWYESLNASEQTQAHQLGIEALKRVQLQRRCLFPNNWWGFMAGETVEGEP